MENNEKTFIETLKEVISENKLLCGIAGFLLTFTIGSSIGSSTQKKIDRKYVDDVNEIAVKAVKDVDLAYKTGMIDGMSKFIDGNK